MVAVGLQLGWPATELETGPEPKMAKSGRRSLRQNGRRMAGQLRLAYLTICPAISQSFWTPLFRALPRHFAGHFSSILRSGPVSLL